MEVIVVGGGKMGRYLLNELERNEHDVTIVEQDKNKCKMMRERFEADTVNGDGTEPEVLKQAGIEEADVVLAVTKDDQDNLVICQIAERQFDVPRTFSTVNTPGNERLFDWLGVNVAVSSASILAALVNQEVHMQDLKSLLSQNHEELELIRLNVEENCPAEGKKLQELDIPLELVMVSVLRGDTPLVPRGETELYSGDLVICLAREEAADVIKERFSC